MCNSIAGSSGTSVAQSLSSLISAAATKANSTSRVDANGKVSNGTSASTPPPLNQLGGSSGSPNGVGTIVDLLS